MLMMTVMGSEGIKALTSLGVSIWCFVGYHQSPELLLLPWCCHIQFLSFALICHSVSFMVFYFSICMNGFYMRINWVFISYYGLGTCYDDIEEMRLLYTFVIHI